MKRELHAPQFRRSQNKVRESLGIPLRPAGAAASEEA
jgi:hypothetical protein